MSAIEPQQAGEKRSALFAAVEAEERRQGDLLRRVQIVPEFDCHDRCFYGKATCRPGSGGWHGIGSRRIVWSVAVVGQGGISFDLHAPIYTENALLRGGGRLEALIAQWSPLGALDIHYANPPEYLVDLGWGPKDCDLIEGKCWTDVTYMAADDGYEAFTKGGTEGVWSWIAETLLPDVLAPASGSRDGES